MKAMATKKQFINEAAPALILKANNRFEIVDNHVATSTDYNNSYSVKYIKGKPNYVIDEFCRGYYDCKQGLSHSDFHNNDYDCGYNTRYQEEQIAGAKS